MSVPVPAARLPRWVGPVSGVRTSIERARAFAGANPVLVLCGMLLAAIALLLLIGPLFAGDPAAMSPLHRLKPPSAAHWLGTDNYGRDVWSRLLNGGRSSMLLAAAVMVSVLGIALAVALACGFSRIADSVFMRIMDAWMAFPAIVLAMALAIAFGAGAVTEYVALVIVFTPSATRILRSRVLAVASREFIASARAAGMSTPKTMLVHVVPHALPLLLVQAAILMALAMLVDGGLSFLGLGIAPPTPTWGNMIAEGRAYMAVAPLLIAAPGLAIVACVALLNVLGNALRPLLDPEVRLLLQLQRLRAAGGGARRPAGPAPGEAAAKDGLAGGCGTSEGAWHDGAKTLLELRGVSVRLAAGETEVELVHEVSLAVESGQTLCIVGESGSGKTVTAMSIVRLLEFAAPVRTTGAIRLDGTDLVALTPAEMRRYRGKRIGMVFQEALDSLNPSQRIGRQLTEAYRGEGLAAPEGSARGRAEALLAEVGLHDAQRIMGMYPHQLSGGMQQRVMIALALMASPELLIADEPTTALDVTTQAEILALLARVQREHRMGCIFITHDMAVAAQVADRIAVMYGGRLVEVGQTDEVLFSPRHRYTRELLRCIPRGGTTGIASLPTIPGHVPSAAQRTTGCRFADRCAWADESCRTSAPRLVATNGGAAFVACWHPGDGPVDTGDSASGGNDTVRHAGNEAALSVRAVSRVYRVRERPNAIRRRAVAAVDAVSLEVQRGEFFGLVGESGSGKSTLGRMIVGLDRPTAGAIEIGGGFVVSPGGIRRRASSPAPGGEREFRRFVQPVFQDPRSSLDPRHTVAQLIAEPLRELTELRGEALRTRVRQLMSEVGLPLPLEAQVAAQLSGGQQQRVAIARAIAPGPQLIIADEPTSALDVSVQGQVMNLLLELRRSRGIAYVFITHNLNLVLSIADRVGVMQHGRLVETGTPAQIIAAPRHEYTRRLLAANPTLPSSRDAIRKGTCR